MIDNTRSASPVYVHDCWFTLSPNRMARPMRSKALRVYKEWTTMPRLNQIGHFLGMHALLVNMGGYSSNYSHLIKKKWWWTMMNHDEPWWTMMNHDEPWWTMMNHDEPWWTIGFRATLFWDKPIPYDCKMLCIIQLCSIQKAVHQLWIGWIHSLKTAPIQWWG